MTQTTETAAYAAVSVLVPRRGLEPPRLAAHPPQGCVYTNFTTWAFISLMRLAHYTKQ